jgi:zinc transport system substrate-binding protein
VSAVRLRIVLILMLAACGSLLAGCGEANEEAGSGGTKVVAAFYPLAFAADEIGGDDVSVTNLTPPGVEPHDLELSVGDVRRVHDADVVLYLGRGFQPSLEDALEGSNARAVDLLDEVGVSGDDPHVWLDPVLYGKLVRAVGVALGKEAEAEDLAGQVDALADEYREGLATCERRDIVTSHAAYGYLSRSYALNQVPIAGLSPEAEASPQDLKRIAEFVRDSGTTTVFVEPLAPPDEAETIARETGAETASLDPLEGLTEDEVARGENYFSVMRANLEALRTALGCR